MYLYMLLFALCFQINLLLSFTLGIQYLAVLHEGKSHVKFGHNYEVKVTLIKSLRRKPFV